MRFKNNANNNKANTPVNEQWNQISEKLHNIMAKNIPSKLTTTRFNQPWITRHLKRLARRKKKAYKPEDRWSSSSSAHNTTMSLQVKSLALLKCYEFVLSLSVDIKVASDSYQFKSKR
jgi:hypothetical protein